MKMIPRVVPRRFAAAALAAALGLPAPPLAAQTAPGAARTRAPVTVNFVNADIEAVARAFGAMIDRQILVDPRVKGTITVYSEQPQTVAEAYQGFLAALRGLGYAVVDSGGLLKVVPEADAKLQTGTVSIGEAGTVRGDQVVTQIFQLRYESANNLVAVLRPLISANNTINASPGSNSLIITDYAENLRRIGKIVATLDQPAFADLEIVPLEHAIASDIAPLVQRVADVGVVAGAPGAPGAAGASTVVPDPRSNALIVRASNPARMAAILASIAKLDRPGPGGPGGQLWVVHLKNADATRLATVLRAAFAVSGGAGAGATAAGTLPGLGPGTTPGITPTSTGLPGTTGGMTAAGTSSLAAAPVAPSAQPSTGGFIQADPATNSLIITAPEPLYRQVRAMIDQLDSRRAQIYIESLIVEVSGDNAADFGLQWQGLLGARSGDKNGLFGGTNFSVGGSNIVSLTTQTIGGNIGGSTGSGGSTGTGAGLSIGEGLNIGILRNYGGTFALSGLARMFESQGNTNIVSTPNLITLDNEEAKIVVGENVPFVTGQFTNTGSAITNPFQTIERKDVGITLRIRPQVGEGGTVRMTIYQEQSAVQPTAAVGTSNAGPSTTKRSIESQVVVDDGQIIVLGGLIEDRYVVHQSKVPLLGDLPGIGLLFRAESRQRRRTNLMVFLRPVVMRDGDSANRLSLDRYEQIRARQHETEPPTHPVLPSQPPPTLPAPRPELGAPAATVAPPERAASDPANGPAADPAAASPVR